MYDLISYLYFIIHMIILQNFIDIMPVLCMTLNDL